MKRSTYTMTLSLFVIIVLLSVCAVVTPAQALRRQRPSSSRPQSDRLQYRARDAVFPQFNQTTCEEGLPQLVCNVTPTKGNSVSGFVIFTPTWTSTSSCYTHINATIYNLTPNAEHGFHVHTFGDLTEKKDGNSTGGHFTNPEGSDIAHGYPDDGVRHWGDFGNLTADADGIANYDRVDDVIRLGAIVGRAITIHADPDEGSLEQPSGNAGSRIGHCVIGYKNPDFVI